MRHSIVLLLIFIILVATTNTMTRKKTAFFKIDVLNYCAKRYLFGTSTVLTKEQQRTLAKQQKKIIATAQSPIISVMQFGRIVSTTARTNKMIIRTANGQMYIIPDKSLNNKKK